jgi:PAS domain S-box-containing protein
LHSLLSSLITALQRRARVQWSPPVRYLGAASVVCLCCALRAQLPSTALPYLFFIPGLMFSGFWFGVGPSILGSVLAVLAAQYFFIGPRGFEEGWSAWANSLSFGVVTLGMAIVCALFRQNLNMMERINQRLEGEVERRTQERDGIWNVSPDLICALSEQGELLAMNPAWQTETGWSEQELRDGVFSAFIPPAQLSEALLSLRQQPMVEQDTTGICRNGQPVHLNWRIARRHGKYFAVARDVTLFKERQDALEQVRSQLQQSQKMEAVGQLTGGLAHDFNNLLTVISGSLELLQARVEQGRIDNLARYISLAQAASARAASLTHRLLAYSRRQTLASKPVDPAALIQSMKELISRTLTPRVDLRLVVPTTSVLCFCDAHQLENVVLNLCINARDAMPQGGRLQVEVTHARIESPAPGSTLDPGDYAVIRVSDTGTGMPESIVQRAFDPFFTTKPLGVGTGLGLSMVYGFARQSAGEARIESVVGAGTAVSVFLPLYDGPQPETAPVAVPTDNESAVEALGEVLVVDDEVAIRDLVAEVLEDAGYDVSKAATAAEALALLTYLPDLKLLVTDIGLPGGMSGDELAAAALRTCPGLKIVFISGFSENAVPTAGFEAGRVHLLLKPFSMDDLMAGIRQLIEAR